MNDDEIDALENEVPRLAQEAARRAFERSIAAGLDVDICEGTSVFRVNRFGLKMKVRDAQPQYQVRKRRIHISSFRSAMRRNDSPRS